MQGVIDRHGLRNSLCVRMRWIDLPAGIQLDERQKIGCVSIDFVRRHVNEHCFWAVAARGLEQSGSSICVDGEVGDGIGGCPIVRGLRCRMNNEIDFVAGAAKDSRYLFGVAYVHLAMDIVAIFVFEALAYPARRSFGAEEVAAHVIVDADYIPSLGCVIGGCLRSHQTGGAGNNCETHVNSPDLLSEK